MSRMLSMPGPVSAVAIAVLLPTTALGAQASSGAIALSGGVSTDQRGARSNAFTLAPVLGVALGPAASLQLSGDATRFATQAWSLGGGAALATRAALGAHAALTLNASAGGSRLGGAGASTFMESGVTPAIEARHGLVTLFAGARAAVGRTSARFEPRAPSFPFQGQASTSSVSRRGVGPLYGVNLTFAGDGGVARVGVRADRMRIDGISVADHALAFSAEHGAVSVSANAGSRSAPDENTAFGGGEIAIAMGGGASLDLGAGRYPSNRLLGTPGGGYATAGISFAFGATPRPERPLPKPSGARAPAPGTTRLSLRAPDARRVEIAGDFTEWQTRPATRAENGVWFADLAIPPGQYRYAFRVDGREWRVPDGATAVDDGFGGKSAWLTVRDQPRK